MKAHRGVEGRQGQLVRFALKKKWWKDHFWPVKDFLMLLEP